MRRIAPFVGKESAAFMLLNRNKRSLTLDLKTAETIAAFPEIAELNIGHFLVGEALFGGLSETVKAMRAAMDRGVARRPAVP